MLSGTFTVDFWSYNGGGTFSSGTLADASNSILSAPASASFTYTGALNWFVPGPQGGLNLAGPFVLFSGGTISGYTSPSGAIPNESGVGGFETTSLSSIGNSLTSFFQITGSGMFSGGTITHDDGASLYLDGGSAVVS